MRKKRRRQSATSPQRLFEPDGQAFTHSSLNFLTRSSIALPRARSPNSGTAGMNQERGLNAGAVFGFCVWQQPIAKGMRSVEMAS